MANVMNEQTIAPPQDVIKTNGHGPVPELVAAPSKASQKKKRLVLAGAVAALVAVSVAVPLLYSAFTHESTDDAFIDGHIITIAPKVAGQVLAVHVEDNQLLKSGDPIAEIDPRDYQAKVAEQRGKLAAAPAEA